MVNFLGMKTRKNSSEVSVKETTKILIDIFRSGRQKELGDLRYAKAVIWLIRRAYLDKYFLLYFYHCIKIQYFNNFLYYFLIK